MSPNITDQLHLTLEYVDPTSQLRVTLSTYGEIERTRFERTCKTTHINPDNFNVYVEERQRGKSAGETDRYLSIKSDRCLRDVVFESERFYFTHTHKRLRSFPDVRRLYRSTEQIVDECMSDLLQEFEAVKAPKAPKVTKNLSSGVHRQEPPTSEVGYGMGIITTHRVGKNTRTLCRHPFNMKYSPYGIPCSQHTYACKCPVHRKKTFWRRLTGSLQADRNSKINKNGEYMKFVVGMTHDEYHKFLVSNFQKTFIEILPYDTLIKNFDELRAENFVIDEMYPRCEGQHIEDPHEIAIFLAKVFNHKNTQLIIHNNVEARRHGVDPKKYGMLINGSKGGIVYAGTKENFDEIEPSREAVSYMLKFVHDFIEKEPKLEIRL